MTSIPNSIRIPLAGSEEKAVKTKIICALALGLSMTATAAAAQDRITIESNVPNFCQSLSGFGATPLSLGELSDSTGQVVEIFSGDTQTSLSSYYCNGPATISLQANPLLLTPAETVEDPSFTGEVHYLASLSWSDMNVAAASTAGSATVVPTAMAKVGELVVTISDPSTVGDRRPVAGHYEGSVVLNVNFN